MNLKDAKKLALAYIKDYCPDYSFQFNNAKRAFGMCSPRKKTIYLSRYLVRLNSEAEVKDVILHEIAHALTPTEGHGIRWKLKAQEIGCRPERCYSNQLVKTPPRKFKGTCPKCGRVIARHKRMKISCGTCSKVFDESLVFVWELNK